MGSKKFPSITESTELKIITLESTKNTMGKQLIK